MVALAPDQVKIDVTDALGVANEKYSQHIYVKYLWQIRVFRYGTQTDVEVVAKRVGGASVKGFLYWRLKEVVTLGGAFLTMRLFHPSKAPPTRDFPGCVSLTHLQQKSETIADFLDTWYYF